MAILARTLADAALRAGLASARFGTTPEAIIGEGAFDDANWLASSGGIALDTSGLDAVDACRESELEETDAAGCASPGGPAGGAEVGVGGRTVADVGVDGVAVGADALAAAAAAAYRKGGSVAGTARGVGTGPGPETDRVGVERIGRTFDSSVALRAVGDGPVLGFVVVGLRSASGIAFSFAGVRGAGGCGAGGFGTDGREAGDETSSATDIESCDDWMSSAPFAKRSSSCRFSSS